MAAAFVVLAGSELGRGQDLATVCARDQQNLPIAGATVSRGAEQAGAGRTQTGADGCVSVAVAQAGYARGVLSAERPGYASATVNEPQPGERVMVVLHGDIVQQSVTVTADRGLEGVTDRATTVTVLDAAQLASEPGLGLDDRLHQVAGFGLYRRTSSWTANPTTEGVSLRGLGSTAASRTLVESDEVPLNDPFGGWIHWDETPQLAIADVIVERGGAADLYGSSAIGGVIALEAVVAGGDKQVEADMFGAGENSAGGDLLATGTSRFGSGLLAGSGLNTGGYVPTAPAFRGAVDTVSSVAEESGRVELRAPFGQGTGLGARGSGSRAQDTGVGGMVFLRGNVLNEERGNGTPDQTNGTRLWRFAGGGDVTGGVTHGSLRVFGDRETYRQSFSAIAADRNSEALTRLQRVPVDEFGFSVNGARGLPGGVTLGAGLDLRDIRATDAETPVSGGALAATTATSAHQRELGGYLEGVWQARGWSAAGSVRVDEFRTFDARQVTGTHASPSAMNGAPSVVPEPEVDELVASPHLGLVRQLPGGLALTASAFRAFRGPTMNELYRTGQVGQQTTLANPSLLSERATGLEFGGEFADMKVRGRELGRLRASYFWTEVNRPVSAVLLSETATAQTLQRQNLGQIRSRGLSLEAGTGTWRGLDAGVGYQLAVATVTAFNTSAPLQANLTGKWIPEVPRNTATAAVNFARPEVGMFHVLGSYVGREFDDTANQFVLSGYARVDLSAERGIWRGLRVYAGVQNVLNRRIEAGRTPVLTLSAPRLVEGGLRWETMR